MLTPNTLLFVRPLGDALPPVVDDISKFLYAQFQGEECCLGHVNSKGHFQPGVKVSTEPIRSALCNCVHEDRKEKLSVPNIDVLLPCGLVTSLLSLHTLVFHRDDVPIEEMHTLLLYAADVKSQVYDDENLLAQAKHGLSIKHIFNGATNVHHGIECDMCQMNPIVGPRFKCEECFDFDMCATCEAKDIHTRSHKLVKIKVPETYKQNVRPRNKRQCMR